MSFFFFWSLFGFLFKGVTPAQALHHLILLLLKLLGLLIDLFLFHAIMKTLEKGMGEIVIADV